MKYKLEVWMTEAGTQEEKHSSKGGEKYYYLSHTKGAGGWGVKDRETKHTQDSNITVGRREWPCEHLIHRTRCYLC